MFILRESFKSLSLHRSMAFFYAVARGHKVGVYPTWALCEQQVKGFKGAKYKKFKTMEEAQEFIKNVGGSPKVSSATHYEPTDHLVALGKGKSVEAAELVPETKKIEDVWPESDGDTFLEDVTDADLLAALEEVEGVMTITTRKRSACDGSAPSKKIKYDESATKQAGVKKIGSMAFALNDKGYVIVYTDGSCINNGRPDAHAGFGVYFGEDHILNASKPVIGRVTNNVGEIQAAVYAIKVAKDLGIRRLLINTDSQFLINAATQWISAWKRKHWQLKSGGPVKNVDDFKILDELLADKTVDVEWNYVTAHAGIAGNEMADKLAREGSKQYLRLKSAKTDE